MMRVENRTNAAENRSRTLANTGFRCSCGRRIEGKKNGLQVRGLMPKRLSNDCVKHSAVACFLKADGGIILSSLPLKGRGLGGLLERRIIAAPHCRGVFHFGLDSFAVHSRMGAPRGNLSGLMHPFEHSANLRGVAHQLGGCVNGVQYRSKGECTMSATQSKVLSPEVVQAFLAGRSSSDLSHDVVDRIKAAADAVFALTYKTVNAASPCSEIEQAGSAPDDVRGFVRGLLRAVAVAKTEYDYAHGVPASASGKGANHV